MPAKYEAIRDKLAKGAPVNSPQYNAAQTSAARIYNAQRKRGQAPVTGPERPRRQTLAEAVNQSRRR
jgi:hypothetical protein